MKKQYIEPYMKAIKINTSELISVSEYSVSTTSVEEEEYVEFEAKGSRYDIEW